MPHSNGSDSDQIEKEVHLGHSTTTISLTPEQFEKLYLSPKTPRASQNATRYANAAPLGFMGYVVIQPSDKMLRTCKGL